MYYNFLQKFEIFLKVVSWLDELYCRPIEVDVKTLF